MPRMLRINHVTLVVDDLAEACRFYEEEFDLEALQARGKETAKSGG